MTFSSIEEVLSHVITTAGIDPGSIEEVPASMSYARNAWCLNVPGMSKTLKQMFEERLTSQKTFSVKSRNGAKMQLIICPLRNDRYECYVISSNGLALQL